MTGRPALERCAGDPERFLAEHWGRQPLLRPAGDQGAGRFDDLLSLADIDTLVSSTSLRLPAFRLVKDGSPLPTSSYTKSGKVGGQQVSGMADAARVHRQFEQGATIVLQSLHRYWPPLASFCRQLELDLSHPVQVNAYITPPGSRGLAVHRDDHDVFVLQVFGRKHWEVFEPSKDLPPSEPPSVESELQPGDALYIPRFFPHAARTPDEGSGHLTIGILSYRWRTVVDEAVAMAREGFDELDEPLPAGFAEDEALEGAIRERLDAFGRRLAMVDTVELARRLADRFHTSRQSVVPGQLQQVLALPRLGEHTMVRRRVGSMCRVERQGTVLSLLLGDRELRLPSWVEPAVRRAAEGSAFTSADLHDWMDPESAMVLVRRLVREGLLEAALER